jgi:hypothetical protein
MDRNSQCSQPLVPKVEKKHNSSRHIIAVTDTKSNKAHMSIDNEYLRK